jgi:hypothetical protein
MHGERNVKFINAREAKSVYHYRNIKEKLLSTNTSIWFNKICKIELSPKYIHITVNGNNKKCINTKKADKVHLLV